MKTLLAVFLFVGVALAQKKCSQKQEVHLPMAVEVEGATENLGVVLDSNWRWTHIPGDFTNCYTGMYVHQGVPKKVIIDSPRSVFLS